ncbi:uncharacterized protein B0H64DRAFT_374584 [Chaetomium fimeti]|uniref:Uncharacterized protein n=1 Tax=Chaetomium fimeti TaxID=1854472 RepID=A0AAE0HHE9_9PEZI|nr:hypothetical protein B0H64DRAFT_374584 [Chaetomium fimeti]
MDKFRASVDNLLSLLWAPDVATAAAGPGDEFWDLLRTIEGHAAARLLYGKGLDQPLADRELGLDGKSLAIAAVVCSRRNVLASAMNTIRALCEGAEEIAEWSKWPDDPLLQTRARECQPPATAPAVDASNTGSPTPGSSTSATSADTRSRVKKLRLLVQSHGEPATPTTSGDVTKERFETAQAASPADATPKAVLPLDTGGPLRATLTGPEASEPKRGASDYPPEPECTAHSARAGTPAARTLGIRGIPPSEPDSVLRPAPNPAPSSQAGSSGQADGDRLDLGRAGGTLSSQRAPAPGKLFVGFTNIRIGKAVALLGHIDGIVDAMRSTEYLMHRAMVSTSMRLHVLPNWDIEILVDLGGGDQDGVQEAGYDVPAALGEFGRATVEIQQVRQMSINVSIGDRETANRLHHNVFPRGNNGRFSFLS